MKISSSLFLLVLSLVVECTIFYHGASAVSANDSLNSHNHGRIRRRRRHLQQPQDSGAVQAQTIPTLPLLFTSALNYDSNIEIDQVMDPTACVDGPPENGSLLAPDAQTTTQDSQCQQVGQCHLSNTEIGELVAYNVYPSDVFGAVGVDFLTESYKLPLAGDGVTDIMTNNIQVQVTLRLSAPEEHTKSVEVALLPLPGQPDVQFNQAVPALSNPTPLNATIIGGGFQSFTDVSVGPFTIDSTLDYQLVVDFIEGHINMCSIEVVVLPQEERTMTSPTSPLTDLDNDVSSSETTTTTTTTTTATTDTTATASDGVQDGSGGRRSVPFAISATKYDDWNEADSVALAQHRCQDGQMTMFDPDFESTLNDVQCQSLANCHITELAPGEFLMYNFVVEDLTLSTNPNQIIDTVLGVDNNSTETMVYVDITVRVASNEPQLFQLGFMDGPTNVQNERFVSPGQGSQNFQDVTWSGVKLLTSKPFHALKVEFLQYGIDICSVSVKYSTERPVPSVPIPPFTWSAIQYDDALDLSQPENLGDGCGGRLDGVDTIQTDDDVCNQRDNSFCAVSYTSVGEFLEYKFDIPESEVGMHDIRIRVAAFNPDSKVRLDIFNRADLGSPYEKTLDIPFSENDKGKYHDLIWTPTYPLKKGEYILTVNLQNEIEVCSISVLDSQVLAPPTLSPSLRPTGSPSLSPVPVPSQAPTLRVTNSPSLPPAVTSTDSPIVAVPVNEVIPAVLDSMNSTTDIHFQQSIENSPGVPVPGTYSALTFVGANDTTPTNDLGCPVGGPVDAQIVANDDICMNAVGFLTGTTCTIANTFRGEWLLYRFTTSGQTQDRINLSLRLASANANRNIQVQIYPDEMGPSQIFSSPGLGFQNYSSIIWENLGIDSSKSSHDVKVTFLDGKVNLCAVTVEYPF